MNRDKILERLLLLVRRAAPFITTSRRLNWIQDQANLPAAFVVWTADEYQQRGTGFPPRRSLAADVIVYVATDPQDAPSRALDPLVAAVEEAIRVPHGQAQTLGGIVEHCFIGGDDGQKAKIEIFEGHASNRAAAIIPVRILVP